LVITLQRVRKEIQGGLGGNGGHHLELTWADLHGLMELCGNGNAPIRVYTTLLAHRNGGTGEAWPSNGRVAKLTGLTRPTVNGAIQALLSWGYLEVVERGNGGPSRYSFPRVGGCKPQVTPGCKPQVTQNVSDIEHNPPLSPPKGEGVADAMVQESPTVQEAEKVIATYGKMMIPCGVAKIRPEPVARRLRALAAAWEGFTVEATCQAITTEANRLGRLGHGYKGCPRLLDLLDRWEQTPPAPVRVKEGGAA
jgi:hypothetical protein